ncbi:MAG: hypothetical protein JRI68_07720, partial [Deltaproteobacteria bacterium]|nr:hypothetical protein [Deltaproteobacteria bacterium]
MTERDGAIAPPTERELSEVVCRADVDPTEEVPEPDPSEPTREDSYTGPTRTSRRQPTSGTDGSLDRFTTGTGTSLTATTLGGTLENQDVVRTRSFVRIAAAVAVAML